MRLFAYIGHNSKERHARNACAAQAAAPMLDTEENWPICQDCIKAVRDELRKATGHRRNEPVRCDSCAAWVLPGNACGTCQAVAT